MTSRPIEQILYESLSSNAQTKAALDRESNEQKTSYGPVRIRLIEKPAGVGGVVAG
jgi:hypothetical protein